MFNPVITLVLEVTVAANGLQAWKILKDLSNHFDLILCEVDLPCLSGVSLLCNIMRHNIRKDIPVVSKYIDVHFIATFNTSSL